MSSNHFWKLSKLLDIKVQSIFKSPIFHLKGIAGVEHHDGAP